MNISIFIVILLSFIITLIGTLAYSVRIVGVRTGRIAISFALFNVLALVSRTANVIQVPLLTKYVEKRVNPESLLGIFNLIIITAGVATIVGAVLIPTFQRIFCKAVISFSIERSFSKLLLHSFSKAGIRNIKSCVKIPVKENITKVNLRKLPVKIIIYNLITVSLLTVGSLAPVYAGSIEPNLRATCITLSSVVNSLATILMTLFVDPHLSVMTDDVVDGKCTEEEFRGCIVGMVGSKVVGTFLSMAIFIPASYAIVFVAKII